jgi:integrase
MYAAADQMRWPNEFPFDPADWWRGLLILGYMTGWRIGAMLALRRADVDFEAGTAISRADDNKGKRDQLIPLHPVVLEHLRRLASFELVFLPWNKNRHQLYEEFRDLQQKASIKANNPRGQYGFHDLRRAFATLNADKLTPDALQHLMQHKDYQTTQRYINMARQLNPAVQNLFVPDLPPRKAAES